MASGIEFRSVVDHDQRVFNIRKHHTKKGSKLHYYDYTYKQNDDLQKSMLRGAINLPHHCKGNVQLWDSINKAFECTHSHCKKNYF